MDAATASPLKAVDQLGIGGGGRSNACVDFLKGRLRPRSAVETALAAPSRSPAMCLCVGSRARTGCRLMLAGLTGVNEGGEGGDPSPSGDRNLSRERCRRWL